MRVKNRILISTLLLVAIFINFFPQSIVADINEYIEKSKNSTFKYPDIIKYDEVSQYKKSDLLRLPSITSSNKDFDSTLEIVEIDKYSKTYKDNDRYKTVFSEIPNTYTNKLGRETIIDNTLVKKGRLLSSDYFTNVANDFNVNIPIELKKNEGIVYSKDGVEVELIPQDGDYTNITALENAVLFNDVYEGVDVQYTILNNTAKEDIILNKQVEIDNFKYQLITGVNIAKLENGVINIYKPFSKIPTLLISAPQMNDALGAISDKIELKLEKKDFSYEVTVIPDDSWINSNERAYPIKIDPNVTVAPQKITLLSTSEFRGVYSSRGYGYAGFLSDDDIGVPLSGDLGKTRMYLQINEDFSAIPSEAVIEEATLSMYQYARPGGANGLNFISYYLEDAWNDSTITWSNSLNLSKAPTGEKCVSESKIGFHNFDVKEAVNNWITDIAPNYGLVIMGENENLTGGAFYTPLSSASSGGQAGFTEDKAPKIVVDWSIPDPVDINTPIDSTTVNLRTLIETDKTGKLMYHGVFIDGIAKPASIVSYELNDTSKNYANNLLASFSYKYPNSSNFDSSFPKRTTKYNNKLSNYQSIVPFINHEFNILYNFNVFATENNTRGQTVTSDNFIIYKIKQFDTLPKIANYYGVPLNQIIYDNKVQDMLLVENNTIFIRNPKKNANKPYNPEPLSDTDKAKIDSLLMGRGMHCEFGFEPINLNTGNFYMEQIDSSIEDFGNDFNITRTYNSKAAGYNSVFGRGWQFEYSEVLSKKENGSIVYLRSDGSSMEFTPEGDGTYKTEQGYYLELQEIIIDKKNIDFGDGEEEFNIYEYEIKDKDNNIKRFNSIGQLVKITDIKGYETILTYDDQQNIKSIKAHSGKEYILVYNADGFISNIELPNGKSIKYEYDNDNLVSVSDTLDNEVKFTYNDKNQMISWYDGEGKKIIENTYDSEGRVIKQLDQGDKESELSYSDGQTITVDTNGNKTIYNYDSQYRTTKIQYPDGTIEEKSYANNNLVEVIDKLGNKKIFTYDENGNKTKELRFDGEFKTFQYNDQNKVIKEVDYDGKVNEYEYNSYGDIISIIDNEKNKMTYIYDDSHRLIESKDKNGNITKFEYNGPLITKQIDADNNITEYYHNQMSLLTTLIDSKGNTIRFMYDDEGRKIGEQMADGSFTEFTFDKAGNVIAVKDPKGNRTDYIFDAYDRVIKIIDPKGKEIKYSYDNLGSKISEESDDKSKIEYEYDNMQRLIKVTNGDGISTEYNYDKLGNKTLIIDGNKNETKITYDYRVMLPTEIKTSDNNITSKIYNKVGLLTKEILKDNTEIIYSYDNLNRLSTVLNPNGLEVKYSYDKNSNIINTSDNTGRETLYFYNTSNRLIKEILPSGSENNYKYDELGNLIEIMDNLENKSTINYDTVGRLTSIVDPKGYIKEIHYDLNGNISKEIDEKGNVTSYEYDQLDKIIKSTINNADTYYEYDSSESLTKVKNSLDNEVEYVYNGRGLPIEVKDALGNKHTLKYDNNGNVIEIKAADNSVLTKEYDGLNRLIKETDSEGLVTEYTYDALDRIIREHDNGGNDTKYRYDNVGNLIEIENSIGQKTNYKYDKLSNVTEVITLDGNTIKYEYDKGNNISKITDAEGKETRYQYDLSGNLLSKVDEELREWSYTYDEIGRLIKSKEPNNAETQYDYDEVGNIIKIIDPKGNSSEYQYDNASKLISEKDKNGSETKYQYDAIGRLINITLPNNGEIKYLYDPLDRLIKEKDSLGNIKEYSYDVVGNIKSITESNKGIYTYSYNYHGQVIESIDPLGNKTTNEVDLNGRITKRTLPNKGEVEYEYDLIGRVTKITSPDDRYKEYFYNKSGDLEREVDNEGREIKYSYDKFHKLTDVTNYAGNKTSYSYDERGNLISVVTPKGKETKFGYDILDRLNKEVDPIGRIKEYSYDILGNLENITQNGGRTTSFKYDNLGNVIERINPKGEKSTYNYDSMGNLIKEIDVVGNYTTYEYDLNSRVTKIVGKNKGEINYSYDSMGNIVKIVDEEKRETLYNYDLLNRITKVTDGDNISSDYRYDNMSNLISKTDGDEKTTKFQYDIEGRLTKETNAINLSMEYIYDTLGRLTTSKNQVGETISYDYDKLDNLLSKEYSNSEETVFYGYDNDGNVITMKDETGTTNYQYDDTDNIKSIKMADGNEVSYEYDKFGNLSKLIYPDKKEVKYEYDELDRLVALIDRDGKKTLYEYDSIGNLIKTERPNKTYTKSEYTLLGSISKIENFDSYGNIISTYSYIYDLSGNIIKETVLQNGEEVSREFTYNSRLEVVAVKEIKNNEVEETKYYYDKSGNRVRIEYYSSNKLRKDISYLYDNVNRLTDVHDSDSGNTKYVYDEKGNLIKKLEDNEKVVEYDYTLDNRLKAVKENGSLLMAALYDGNGNRVFTVNRKTVQYSEEISKVDESKEPQNTMLANGVDENIKDDKIDLDNGVPQETSDYELNDYRIYKNPKERIFYYGAMQSLIDSVLIDSGEFTIWLNSKWKEITDKFITIHERIASEKDKGLAEKLGIVFKEFKPVKGSVVNNKGEDIKSDILIPYGVTEKEREDYTLTSYVNDVNRQYSEVLMEYGNNGNVTNIYEYGVNRSSVERYGNTNYYNYDGRGSVSDIINSSGENIASYTYDVFGNGTVKGESYNQYMYNGEYVDSSTDLQYLRARYYDSSISRFITEDSYEGDLYTPLSQNRYTYGQNNPINNVDPSGHFIEKLVKGAKSVASTIVKGVKQAATNVVKAVDKYVVQPVKKAVSTVAKVVKENIIEPVTRWTKDKVVEPAKQAVEKGRESIVTYAEMKREQIRKVEAKLERVYEEVKRKACESTVYVNKVFENVKVTFNNVGKWVEDNKAEIISGLIAVGTVVAVAAAVVATGGACLPALLIAGGVGLGTAGVDVASQMMANGSMDLSKVDLFRSALAGVSAFSTVLMVSTGVGAIGVGALGAVNSMNSELYLQNKSSDEINLGQIALRGAGGFLTSSVIGGVGPGTNAGTVFLKNSTLTTIEETTYNLVGGESLEDSVKQGVINGVISGGTSAGLYGVGNWMKSLCFVDGTMVSTATGLVAIETVAVGMLVYAENPESGEKGLRKVVRTYENEARELVHVRVNGEVISSTTEHPFYVPKRGWTKAVDLKAGDILVQVNGEYVVVEEVNHEILELPVKVYNFEVEDLHTYYVGESSILVHNECGTKGVSNPKPKWWHPNYVDNLSETQTILGVKNVDKGLSTIGSATENVATNTGKAWVGEGYKSITDNAGNVIGYSSSDGMRAFRMQYKPREGMWRANFTENYKYINEFGDITNKQLKNVHIDILGK